jgi:F0F1-type ATP synthase alpha subunit
MSEQRGGGMLAEANRIGNAAVKYVSDSVASGIDTIANMFETASDIVNSQNSSDLVDKDILNNGFVSKCLLFFGNNSGFIYTSVFIVLVFLFSSLLDTILVNNTNSPKSAIFIKYSVRWWTILFCGLLVFNLFLLMFKGSREPKVPLRSLP